MSMSEEIEKLHRLHSQGALTDEEFTLAKKRLIDQLGGPARMASPAAKDESGEPSRLNQFMLSNRERWIGGVCGGLADLTQIPAWSWRVLFVLTALLHGLGVVMYLLLWIFVPRRPAARLATLRNEDPPVTPPPGA